MAERPRLRLSEPEPPYGQPIAFAPGIARVVARNPGPMTYHGTNTWLIETAPIVTALGATNGAGLIVLDPGPEDAAHREAVLAAIGGRVVTAVLVTHHHADHAAGAEALAVALAVPVSAHPDTFRRAGLTRPGHPLADGDRIGPLVALGTPGHAQEHLCFAHDDGVLFTGDHVMGWSTAVVPPPPFGDASDYVRSLRMLRERGDTVLLPAHGPPITSVRPMLDALLSGRARRERQTIDALRAAGPIDDLALTRLLYPALKPGLDRAALSNTRGLLAKLARDGRATERGGSWSAIASDLSHSPTANDRTPAAAASTGTREPR